MNNEILNASSPSPLYDDQNNSSNIENKKNISFYANDTTARPTLRNTGLNELNNDISNSDNSIKFVYELKIILPLFIIRSCCCWKNFNFFQIYIKYI